MGIGRGAGRDKRLVLGQELYIGGEFGGSAHHLNVRAACLAARLMKVVATMRRFGLSEREQEFVWELWGDGTSLRAVARKLGARPEYVRRYVSSTGGVKPAARRRSERCVSKREREGSLSWAGPPGELPGDRGGDRSPSHHGLAGGQP